MIEPAEWWAALCVAARVFPAVWLWPFVGLARGPQLVVFVLSLGLAGAMWPVAVAQGLPPAASVGPLALLREVCIGATFGLAASLPLSGLSWAGSVSGRVWGLPRPAVGGLADLYLWAGLATFAAAGGLRAAVRVLARSFEHAPLSLPLATPERLWTTSAQLLVDALGYSLVWAAPIWASLLLVDGARTLWARTGAGQAPGALRGGVTLASAALSVTAVLTGLPLAVRSFLDAFEGLLNP